MKREVMYSI